MQLDRIHGDVEERGAFVIDVRSLKSSLGAFAAHLDGYVSEMQDLSPPDEAADAHDEAVAAAEAGRDRMLELAEETADDVPGTVLLQLDRDSAFDRTLDAAFERTLAADCALVAIARQAGITLENVRCRQ